MTGRHGTQQRSAQRPDSRGARRDPHLCLAWVEGLETASSTEGVARTIDLTSRGAGLVLSAALQPGRRIAVELLLASGLRLYATGAVAHCRPHGEQFRVGVSFDAPPHLVDEPQEQRRA